MPDFEITSPEGKKFVVTAPEGATQDQVLAYAQSQFKKEPSFTDKLKDVAGQVGDYYKNVNMGALRGAARIGTTLLGNDPERKSSIEGFFKENADPSSLAFKGGDIGAQIAGTAGIGGAFGKAVMGASKVVPGIAGIAPKVATALESGGFKLGAPASTTMGKVGDALIRAGAGAATGGAMAGLVKPEDAATGAVIGGAFPIATKVAGLVGSGLKTAGEHILGAMTGAGSEAVREALKAGKVGSREFLENMRGETSFDDVVASAKQGLRNMRAERGAQYRSGMIDIKADKSVLDMSPIVSVVDDLKASSNFKGKVINEKSSGVVKEIADKVDDWAKSNPAEFHTPEGLDALKQAIGDIRDSTQFGTNARRAADSVYNAIKSQIDKQAPTYSKVMKEYSEASKTISEIEKALSLGEKSSKDTAIRKLQSLMRNNAQTNYGNRLDLAKTLEQKGGVDLGPSIAGQAMNSWLPRGMVGAIGKAGMVGLPFVAPKALAVVPFTSPRLMGEVLYGMGKLSGGAGGALGMNQAALQPGVNGALSEIMRNPAARAGVLTLSNP